MPYCGHSHQSYGHIHAFLARRQCHFFLIFKRKSGFVERPGHFVGIVDRTGHSHELLARRQCSNNNKEEKSVFVGCHNHTVGRRQSDFLKLGFAERLNPT